MPDAEAADADQGDTDVTVDADWQDSSCPEITVPRSQGVCAGDGFCWQTTRPAGVDWYGVWGSGPADVWAVGNGGTIAHFDGGQWSLVESPTISNLRDVWGFSPQDVWIVGEDAAAFHFDGTGWSSLDLSVAGVLDLYSVWGAETGDIWIVGEEATLIHHVEGATTVHDGRASADRYRLFGTAAGDIRYVGPNLGIGHWNGSQWSLENVPTPWHDGVTGIWASGPSDYWATGFEGGIARYDGQSWSVAVAPLDLAGYGHTTVTGSGPEDVWFLGGAQVTHFDGSAFVPFDPPDEGTEMLNDAWMSSSGGEGWAVGFRGRMLHFDGERWQSASGAPLFEQFPRYEEEHLLDVFVLDERHGWAVGKDNILAFDGERWTSMADAPDGDWTSVWAFSPDDIWVIGGLSRAIHWDGQSWRDDVDAHFFVHSFDMWAAGPDNMWFGTSEGLVHWNGVEMSLTHGWVEQSWTYLDGAAPDQVWAVSQTGVYRFDGQWEQQAMPEAPDGTVDVATAVRVFGPNDVWVGSCGGVLARWDGSEWTQPLQVPFAREDHDGMHIAAITGQSPTDMWITTYGGDVYHYDGACWTMAASLGVEIKSVAQAPSGALFAVGAARAIIHRQ